MRPVSRRYRVRDALKGVTKHAVREARRKEIRQEILNSEILKQHFEENPRDAEVLRHDAGLSSARKIKPHLKHLPGTSIHSTEARFDGRFLLDRILWFPCYDADWHMGGGLCLQYTRVFAVCSVYISQYAMCTKQNKLFYANSSF